MDLRQLRTFLTVVTLESFNKAADALGLAQSTVSDQVRSLEAGLGRQLIDRDGRRLRLSAAGETLLPYARTMLDLEAQLRSELRDCGGHRGSLVLRIPETVSVCLFPRVLGHFQERFPLVELSLQSCCYFGLVEELRSGLTNLAFLISDGFRAPDLESVELRPVSLVLVCAPGKRLHGHGPLSLADLAGQSFFILSGDCDYFKLLERQMIEAKLKFGTLRRMNSIQAIKRNLALGDGCALLTRDMVADELAAGTLVELDCPQAPRDARLLLIWQKDNWQAPPLRALVELVRSTLGPDA
jgi:DNA-binding transcriptional LysR family regulator